MRDDFRAEMHSIDYQCKGVLDRRINYDAKFTGVCGRHWEGPYAVGLLAFRFFVPKRLVTREKSG